MRMATGVCRSYSPAVMTAWPDISRSPGTIRARRAGAHLPSVAEFVEVKLHNDTEKVLQVSGPEAPDLLGFWSTVGGC